MLDLFARFERRQRDRHQSYQTGDWLTDPLCHSSGAADEITGCVAGRKRAFAACHSTWKTAASFSGQMRIKVQPQQCPCPSHLGPCLLYLPLHLLLKGGFQQLCRL